MDLIRTKLGYLTSTRDCHLKKTLQLIVEDDAGWRVAARSMLLDMMEMINRNEGLSLPLPAALDELGDLVPAHVANIIHELNALLWSGPSLVREEERETPAFLLLKVAEWMALNYEGRCLYGEAVEQEARRLYERAGSGGMTVWGDKDEIWAAIQDIMVQWGLGDVLAGCRAVLGCRTYGFVLERMDLPVVLNSANWQGGGAPPGATLVIGLRTESVDVTLVQAGLKASGPRDSSCKSTSRFERSLLSATAQACGSPEHPAHPVFNGTGRA